MDCRRKRGCVGPLRVRRIRVEGVACGDAARRSWAKGRKYKRCTRYVQAGNTLHFSGRLNGRKLRPGTYRLQAIASIDGLTSKPVTVSFTIVR